MVILGHAGSRRHIKNSMTVSCVTDFHDGLTIMLCSPVVCIFLNIAADGRTDERCSDHFVASASISQLVYLAYSSWIYSSEHLQTS